VVHQAASPASNGSAKQGPWPSEIGLQSDGCSSRWSWSRLVTRLPAKWQRRHPPPWSRAVWNSAGSMGRQGACPRTGLSFSCALQSGRRKACGVAWPWRDGLGRPASDPGWPNRAVVLARRRGPGASIRLGVVVGFAIGFSPWWTNRSQAASGLDFAQERRSQSPAVPGQGAQCVSVFSPDWIRFRGWGLARRRFHPITAATAPAFQGLGTRSCPSHRPGPSPGRPDEREGRQG